MYLKKTVRNTVFVFAMSLVGALLGYGFRLFLARTMSVDEYGLFYAIVSFFAFFTLFIDLGFTQSMARTIVELNVKKRFGKIKGLLVNILGIQFGMSLLLGIIFLVMAGKITATIFKAENAMPFLLLLVWFITMPVEVFLKGAFLGFQRLKTVSMMNPVKSGFSLVMVLILFYMKVQWAPFIAYALLNVLLFIVFFVALRKAFPQMSTAKTEFSKAVTKEVLSYGILLTFSSLAWGIMTYTDSIMITFFRDTAEVGLYQIALPLANTMMFLVFALNTVAYPLFSEFKAQKKSKKTAEGISLLYNYLFVGMIPIALIFFAFPELVITILFGAKYVGAVPALKILAIGALFFSLASFNVNLLSATGMAKVTAKLAAVAAVINVAANLLLVPMYGFVGAALTTLLSYLFLMFASVVVLMRTYAIEIPLRKWILNVLAGGAAIGVIYYLKAILVMNMWVESIVTLGIAGVLYAALLVFLRIVNVKEAFELVKQVIK